MKFRIISIFKWSFSISIRVVAERKYIAETHRKSLAKTEAKCNQMVQGSGNMVVASKLFNQSSVTVCLVIKTVCDLTQS